MANIFATIRPDTGIRTCMEIEQVNPKKPNFALIFTLFGASILALLLIAVLVLHFDARKLIPHAGAGAQHAALRGTSPLTA